MDDVYGFDRILSEDQHSMKLSTASIATARALCSCFTPLSSVSQQMLRLTKDVLPAAEERDGICRLYQPSPQHLLKIQDPEPQNMGCTSQECSIC